MNAAELSGQTQSLLDQWTSGLSQVLEAMTDLKPEVRWQSGITLASDPEALWWEQPFQISPGAIVWIATPSATWEHAGKVTLQAAGLDTVGLSEARNTWLEILGQSLGGLARAIGAMVGREVTCGSGTERAPAATPDAGAAVSVRFSDTALPPLWIGFSPELISFIANPQPPASESGRSAPQEETASAMEERSQRRSGAPPTMDLILDVELPVSISFGKTELPMKEVLKLTTGSIVELNRGINDPVEVMVNQCLIARGEVVVVEGNYGVRIQQIASRLDRMRSIR
jgi:flagellar motor switch protein FliN/FliY